MNVFLGLLIIFILVEIIIFVVSIEDGIKRSLKNWGLINTIIFSITIFFTIFLVIIKLFAYAFYLIFGV